MALTNTTLASTMLRDDLIAVLTSVTGLSAYSSQNPQPIRIDNEYMLVGPGYISGVRVNVYRRGDQGSPQVQHNVGATVAFGAASDAGWSNYQPGAVSPIAIPTPIFDTVTYSVNGAIAIPTRSTTVQLDKTGVAAMTLGAPGLDQDGMEMHIVGLKAFANTITAPSAIFNDGTSGSPHTVWTATTGFTGQGVMLKASQGQWLVEANNGGTFS